jgi:hypothetical protein
MKNRLIMIGVGIVISLIGLLLDRFSIGRFPFSIWGVVHSVLITLGFYEAIYQSRRFLSPGTLPIYLMVAVLLIQPIRLLLSVLTVQIPFEVFSSYFMRFWLSSLTSFPGVIFTVLFAGICVGVSYWLIKATPFGESDLSRKEAPQTTNSNRDLLRQGGIMNPNVATEGRITNIEANDTSTSGRLVRDIPLLQGETMVSQLSGLLLTNQRIAYTAGNQMGLAMIKDVDAVRISAKRGSIWLLLLGAVLIIVGIIIGIAIAVTGDDDAAGVATVAILAGVVLGIVYVARRKELLLVTVSGQPLIEVELSKLRGDTTTSIDGFVGQLFKLKSAHDVNGKHETVES